MTRQTEEQRLVAQYLAKGGKITQCPPRTFALEAYEPKSWREQGRAAVAEQITAAKAREARAKEAAKIPTGQRPKRKPPMPTFKATDAQILAVIDLPTAKAAELVGLSVRRFNERAAKLGKPVARPKGVLDPTMVEMIAAGFSVLETATAFGVTEMALKHRVRKAGLSVSSIRARRSERVAA